VHCTVLRNACSSFGRLRTTAPYWGAVPYGNTDKKIYKTEKCKKCKKSKNTKYSKYSKYSKNFKLTEKVLKNFGKSFCLYFDFF
jgi:hypothetical protein